MRIKAPGSSNMPKKFPYVERKRGKPDSLMDKNVEKSLLCKICFKYESSLQVDKAVAYCRSQRFPMAVR